MKRRFFIALLSLVVLLITPTIIIKADQQQWDDSKATKEISFGEIYTMTPQDWDRNYFKVIIPKKGIMVFDLDEISSAETIKGKYFEFNIYKEKECYANNGIQANIETGHLTYGICLNPGTYYIRLKMWDSNFLPEDFTMHYCFSFTPNSYSIYSATNPNDGYTKSSIIQLNKEYAGYTGTHLYDSFQFELKEDSEVAIIINNYANIFAKGGFFELHTSEDSNKGFYKRLNPNDAQVDKSTGNCIFTYTLTNQSYYFETWSSWNSIPYTIKVQTPPSVTYRTQVQKEGWQTWRKDGALSGTKTNKRLEGIQIKLQNKPYTGNIQYKTYIQKIGWESTWASNGKLSGTVGKALRLEGIRIKLTGEMSNQYNVYYRTYVEGFGWLGWAKNGDRSGTAGYGYKLEGIQIKLISKSGTAPKSSTAAFRTKGK